MSANKDKNSTTKNLSNLAVLVIDMQQEYFRLLSEQDKKLSIDSHLEIIRYCVKNNIEVISINHDKIKGVAGLTVEPIDKALKQYDNVTNFKKHCWNAFDNHTLVQILRDKNIKEVYLTGIYASKCISSTAIGADIHKFRVITSEDAIFDEKKNSENKNYNKRKLFENQPIKYLDSYKEYFKNN
jgi:nicotinamidase-related amidase